MGYCPIMLIWVALIIAAWIVLSIPLAVVVGRMFAAGSRQPEPARVKLRAVPGGYGSWVS